MVLLSCLCLSTFAVYGSCSFHLGSSYQQKGIHSLESVPCSISAAAEVLGFHVIAPAVLNPYYFFLLVRILPCTLCASCQLRQFSLQALKTKTSGLNDQTLPEVCRTWTGFLIVGVCFFLRITIYFLSSSWLLTIPLVRCTCPFLILLPCQPGGNRSGGVRWKRHRKRCRYRKNGNLYAQIINNQELSAVWPKQAGPTESTQETWGNSETSVVEIL